MIFASLLCVALLGANPSHAIVRYSYTGNTYQAFVDQTPPTGSYTPAMAITGSFELAAPLPPSSPRQDISASVLAFSFDDGRQTITDANVLSSSTIEVSTDAAGNIEEWVILFFEPFAPGVKIGSINTSNLFSGTTTDVGQIQQLGVGGLTGDLGLAFSTPGTWTFAIEDDLFVSFGVQGGQPNAETFSGLAVRPEDALNLDVPSVLSFLPAIEDLDVLHLPSGGGIYFSTTTSVHLDGTQFFPSDVVMYDGIDYSLAFDGSLLDAGQNVDAVTELENGNLLISTATPATLFGFSFLDGDVVEVDLGGGSASLFMGLDEATLFTGTNQNIDALHFDADTGNLLISLLIDGVGTVGGLAYDSNDEIYSSVIELDLSGAPTGFVLLDGNGLYDGATRQLDAIFLPEPSGATALAAGVAFLLLLSRRRKTH
jgi:hypothetical protein